MVSPLSIVSGGLRNGVGDDGEEFPVAFEHLRSSSPASESIVFD